MIKATELVENNTVESAHIVCADDDPDIRGVLEASLEAEGYEVTMCTNGSECWAYLTEAETPAVIILDVMMPGHDGFEVLRRIRNNERLGDVPVIMLTSRSREEDVVDGFDSGANHYVSKPFSPRELNARIRGVL